MHKPVITFQPGHDMFAFTFANETGETENPVKPQNCMLQGGEDTVAAFVKKKSGSLLAFGNSSELSTAQRRVFSALAAASIGPSTAKAITNEHQSIGALVQKITGTAGNTVLDEISCLKAGTRRVGPAAAKKLQWILTSEDPFAKMI